VRSVGGFSICGITASRPQPERQRQPPEQECGGRVDPQDRNPCRDQVLDHPINHVPDRRVIACKHAFVDAISETAVVPKRDAEPRRVVDQEDSNPGNKVDPCTCCVVGGEAEAVFMPLSGGRQLSDGREAPEPLWKWKIECWSLSPMQPVDDMSQKSTRPGIARKRLSLEDIQSPKDFGHRIKTHRGASVTQDRRGRLLHQRIHRRKPFHEFQHEWVEGLFNQQQFSQRTCQCAVNARVVGGLPSHRSCFVHRAVSCQRRVRHGRTQQIARMGVQDLRRRISIREVRRRQMQIRGDCMHCPRGRQYQTHQQVRFGSNQSQDSAGERPPSPKHWRGLTGSAGIRHNAPFRRVKAPVGRQTAARPRVCDRTG
jgi:hypothetical protein